MAYDFPNTPTVGQIFSPPGGPSWQWDGHAWKGLSSSYVSEAPIDGQQYARQSSAWSVVTGGGGGGIAEAPNNANAYVRQALGWVIGYTKAAIDTLLGGKVNKAGDTMTGNLAINTAAASQLLISSTGTNAAVLALSTDAAGASSANQIVGLTNALPRWTMQIGNYEDETGGNAGANISILRHNDAGAGVGWCFNINRATGVVGMPEGSTTVTRTAGDNTTNVATTAFVKANLPIKVSVQSSAPSSPATNDVWIDTT